MQCPSWEQICLLWLILDSLLVMDTIIHHIHIGCYLPSERSLEFSPLIYEHSFSNLKLFQSSVIDYITIHWSLEALLFHFDFQIFVLLFFLLLVRQPQCQVFLTFAKNFGFRPFSVLDNFPSTQVNPMSAVKRHSPITNGRIYCLQTWLKIHCSLITQNRA